MTGSRILFLLTMGLLPILLQAKNPGANPLPTKHHSMGRQAMLFMENKGQVLDQNGDPRTDILFLGRSAGVKVAISRKGISYQFERTHRKSEKLHAKAGPMIHSGMELPEASEIETYRLDMQLLGANPHAKLLLDTPNPYYENYYNVPSAPEGILSVRAFERITLQDVYPGIDWIIYSQGETMKYDFVVHPGADPTRIKITYGGAIGMNLNDDGSMTVQSPLGEIIEDAPLSFSNGERIPSRFSIDDGILNFSLGEYDPQKELLIDPSLVWATYYGGTGSDLAFSNTVDGVGDVYLAGRTNSASFISMGGHQNSLSGNTDAFLAKFNSNGVRLWATYYGGTGAEDGVGVAMGGIGEVYIAGSTGSTNNIAMGGHQNAIGGGNHDAFLVKFNDAGLRIWATYYGGSMDDSGMSTTVDALGNVFLTGHTNSTNNIANTGHQNSLGGLIDAYVVKFNSAGIRLWGTYYGGASEDYGRSIDTDASGNLYMTGHSNSLADIAAAGHQNIFAGAVDAFVAKFNTNGVRDWATYYGGPGVEWSRSICVDGFGSFYLAGITHSISNIASAGFQNANNGGSDAFLVKFSTSGVRDWGTYYGGAAVDEGNSMTTDASGNVYLAGITNSSTDIAANGYQNSISGSFDAYLAKFNTTGNRIWATYYGGTAQDDCFSVAADGAGNAYISGWTASTANIAFGGYQNTARGLEDAFLAKFAGNNPPIANCQNLTLNANASCQGSATAALFDNGSSDPDLDLLSFSANPLSPYPLGTTNVLLSVSDGQGNTATCAAMVTVNDLMPPVMNCPANITSTNDLNLCTATLTYNTPVGTDNCSGATTTQIAGLASGASFPIGTTTNTFRATDAAGNITDCAFTITVTDNQPPAISCPPNISAPTDMGECVAFLNFAEPIGTDNCAAFTSIIAGYGSGATYMVGTMTNTYQVTDPSGNTATCSFTVTVFDGEYPGWTYCPSAMTLNTTTGTCTATAYWMNPFTYDNCGYPTVTSTHTSGSTFNVGQTIVVYTATDPYANTSTCLFPITVNDNEPPVWTNCPSSISVNTGLGTCNAVATWAIPISQDNCGIASSTFSHSPGSTFNLGTTMVNYASTDLSGNDGFCSFSVTVIDNQPPNANCQSITLTLNSSGNGSTTAAAINNASTDNCTIASRVLSQTAFTCADIGANTVTLTVTDASGNSSTCNATVTVLAPPVTLTTQASTAQCGHNISCVGASDGTATAIGAGGCPPYTYAWSNGSNLATATGLTAGIYTVTVTDGVGGSAVQSMVLTEPTPMVANASPIPACTGAANGSIDLSVSGGNNCQAYTFAWSNGAMTEDLGGLAAGTYTLTITDAAACTQTFSQTIAALPLPQPTFTQSGNMLTAAQTWSSYQWLFNGNNISGATASTYLIALSGTYALAVTDPNGCMGVSDTSTIVGISASTTAWDISLHPNPASSEFELTCSIPLAEPITVRIHDMSGRLVLVGELPGMVAEAKFDIVALAAGSYMVEINAAELHLRKLIRLLVH